MRGRALAVCLAAAAVWAAAPSASAATMPGCAPDGAAGGEWRGYGRDLANSRHQSSEKVISAADVPLLQQAWVFSSVANGGAGDFTGTPVVQDGCMYVASTRGWVFAVNADTGKLVWKSQLPYGGAANNTVWVGERRLPETAKKKKKKAKKKKAKSKAKSKPKRRAKPKRKAKRKPKAKAKPKRRPAAAPRTRGTVYIAVTRTQKAEGCPAGDPCIGPYVVALDQATGERVWAGRSLDDQPGADAYGSPVIFDGVLLLGIAGGAAELGDETDRYAFQGSMTFTDADTGALLRKTWTIHPPKQPDDGFAGAGIWSTPAIDADDKVAFAGTANPYQPQAEHAHANAVVRYDVDRSSATFGQITGSYKGNVDEYFPGVSALPCYDLPDNNPPYYPQGLGSCGDIDLDFGAAPHVFKDPSGHKLVGAGQKSGVFHAFDARTMKPVWSQLVGPPGQFGGVVGSTAFDGQSFYGPITIPGYVWSISAAGGAWRWIGPILDGLHWGPPVASANGVIYSVDFTGFLNAFDARTGLLLTKRPLVLGGGGPLALSWGGVSVARNTVYAAVGVLGLADGFIAAYRRGTLADLQDDLAETNLGNGSGEGGGGGGGAVPAGASIVAGPGAASTGYATPVMVAAKGGPLSFVNLDAVQHDVVSVDRGPDGRPLFRTPLIGLGETAPVEGMDRVESGGQYAFFCSIHPGMQGTLSVR